MAGERAHAGEEAPPPGDVQPLGLPDELVHDQAEHSEGGGRQPGEPVERDEEGVDGAERAVREKQAQVSKN